MRQLLVKLRELTKELNANDIVEDGSCLLAVMNMHTEACAEVDLDKLIEFWDNFIEDMKMLGITCKIRSPRINGENGNG